MKAIFTLPAAVPALLVLTGVALAASSRDAPPVLPLAPVAGPSHQPQDGEAGSSGFTFKGVTLGTRASDMHKSLLCGLDGYTPPVQKRCDYRECADVGSPLSGAVTGETDTLAGVPLTMMKYSFSMALIPKGVSHQPAHSILYEMVGNFAAARFGTVKRAFLDRYGKPKGIEPIELESSRGVHFSGEQIFWERDDQYLILSQYDDKLDQSDEWDLEESYFAILTADEFRRVQQCIAHDF